MRRALLAAACLLGACASGQPGDQAATQAPDLTSQHAASEEHSEPAEEPSELAEGPGETAEPTLSLLIGVDAGSGDWRQGGVRSDVLMVMMPGADPAVISLPRDSWVSIPGHGKAKINAAYAWGGPELAKDTVSSLLGQPIEHAYAVNMEGFVSIIDALGPVQIDTVDGTRTLDGAEALSFVRERKSLPRGDLDRIVRQQALLSALAETTDPRAALTLGGDLLSAIAVDGQEARPEDLLSLFSAMRGARFGTAPVAGLGWEGEQSVVYLDGPGVAALGEALGEGSVPDGLLDEQPVR